MSSDGFNSGESRTGDLAIPEAAACLLYGLITAAAAAALSVGVTWAAVHCFSAVSAAYCEQRRRKPGMYVELCRINAQHERQLFWRRVGERWRPAMWRRLPRSAAAEGKLAEPCHKSKQN
ncbi:hypothetical protein JKP88DRAFT_245672 [Tribonema minus]|uniref:Uncharacterized protein n=1 Tax=Tribonema minus TaxID=303371 RepID=A0A835YV43_9STRA|nr:hypothetical protein JKP88DRAFT_245672 [Tribonema minus]